MSPLSIYASLEISTSPSNIRIWNIWRNISIGDSFRYIGLSSVALTTHIPTHIVKPSVIKEKIKRATITLLTKILQGEAGRPRSPGDQSCSHQVQVNIKRVLLRSYCSIGLDFSQNSLPIIYFSKKNIILFLTKKDIFIFISFNPSLISLEKHFLLNTRFPLHF